MLSAKQKEKLVKYAEGDYENHGNRITDTQIRNFLEMSNNTDCYEEFLNFLKYQIGRAKENEENFYKKLLEKVELIHEEFKEEKNIKNLEPISYYFGYMARFSKYFNTIHKNDEGGEN